MTEDEAHEALGAMTFRGKREAEASAPDPKVAALRAALEFLEEELAMREVGTFTGKDTYLSEPRALIAQIRKALGE